MPTPSAAQARGRADAAARPPPGASAVVGSSSSSTFGFESSALTTSRNCRSAERRDSPIRAPGERCTSNSASLAAAHGSISPEAGPLVRGRREEEVLGHAQARAPGRRSGTPSPARGEAPRRRRAACSRWPPISTDALVGREVAAGDPEERRLPGPVLPDHGVDLAGAALHAHVLQRLHGAEPLRDALQRQDDRGFGFVEFVDILGIASRFGLSALLAWYIVVEHVGRHERRCRRLARDARCCRSTLVTCRIVQRARSTVVGMLPPFSFIIAAVSAIRDWKFPPYE